MPDNNEISPFDSLDVSINLKGYRSTITGRRFNRCSGEYQEVEEGRTNEYAAAAYAEMVFEGFGGNRLGKVTIIYRRLLPDFGIYAS